MTPEFNNATFYFSTCTGSGWLKNGIDNAIDAISAPNGVTDILSGWQISYPQHGVLIRQLFSTELKAINDLFQIENTTVASDACKFIKQSLIEFDEAQICGNLYYGFYSIWGGNFIYFKKLFNYYKKDN